MCGVWVYECIYTAIARTFYAQNPKIMHTQIYLAVIEPSQTALAMWQRGTRHLKNVDWLTVRKTSVDLISKINVQINHTEYFSQH